MVLSKFTLDMTILIFDKSKKQLDAFGHIPKIFQTKLSKSAHVEIEQFFFDNFLRNDDSLSLFPPGLLIMSLIPPFNTSATSALNTIHTNKVTNRSSAALPIIDDFLAVFASHRISLYSYLSRVSLYSKRTSPLTDNRLEL